MTSGRELLFDIHHSLTALNSPQTDVSSRSNCRSSDAYALPKHFAAAVALLASVELAPVSGLAGLPPQRAAAGIGPVKSAADPVVLETATLAGVLVVAGEYLETVEVAA